MKKIFFVLLFSIVTFSAFAQSTKKPQLFKYVSTGPDGSVVFTVIDDTRKSTMTLESVDDFYKYQLRDARTDELVLTYNNKGKTGTIDKSNLAAGDYNLFVYTKSFIISSEITISSPLVKTENGVAMVNEN